MVSVIQTLCDTVSPDRIVGAQQLYGGGNRLLLERRLAIFQLSS